MNVIIKDNKTKQRNMKRYHFLLQNIFFSNQDNMDEIYDEVIYCLHTICPMKRSAKSTAAVKTDLLLVGPSSSLSAKPLELG